jgi:ferredoxin--NADP+ reductase
MSTATASDAGSAATRRPGEPALPEAVMHAVLPTAPVTGKVVQSRLCTKGKSSSYVRHVCVDVSGTPLEGVWQAGQSFGVVPPGTDANGKPHKVRLYSIASPTYGEDGEGKVLSTTCKRLLAEREPQGEKDDPADHRLFVGVCSNHVCDLREGDPIAVAGPNGKRFLLPADRDAHDYLFLATGTGVAPFRGFVHELFVGPPAGSRARASWRPTRSTVHLVMGTPYSSDLIYDEFFREVAAANPAFRYHPVISREARPDGGKGEYVHHYVDRALPQFESLLRSERTLIYVCGLAGMQVGIFQTLAARNLHGGYLDVHADLASVPAAQWTTEQVKRRVHATRRCMLEVY